MKLEHIHSSVFECDNNIRVVVVVVVVALRVKWNIDLCNKILYSSLFLSCCCCYCYCYCFGIVLLSIFLFTVSFCLDVVKGESFSRVVTGDAGALRVEWKRYTWGNRNNNKTKKN